MCSAGNVAELSLPACFSGSRDLWADFGSLPSEPLGHLVCESCRQGEDALSLKSWQIPGPDLMEGNVKKAV